MPKQVKNKWLGARADDNLSAQVTRYIEASDNLTMGDLVREAVEEYMINHPVKQTRDTNDALPDSVRGLTGKED